MTGINLLPSERARPRRTASFRLAVTAAVCVFSFSASLLYTLKARQVDELRGVLEAEERAYAGYVWLERDTQRTQKAGEEIAARLAAAGEQVARGLPARDILRRLPQIMPERVWLVEFALADDGKARISGEAASLKDVAAFLVSLDASDLFEGVNLLRAARSEESGFVSFQAEAALSRSRGDEP